MLARKNNDEIYVILLYQMLFIENLKELLNRETTYYETFQIKKSKMFESLKDFAQMFFEMLSNNLNTHD